MLLWGGFSVMSATMAMITVMIHLQVGWGLGAGVGHTIISVSSELS